MYHRNYCTECDWNASTENHSRQELADLVMEHFKETQHDIEGENVSELDQIPPDEPR